MNEDYTERVDLAKKYPEKVAEMRALFEQQARDHQLYPLITWDDLLAGKFHRGMDHKSFKQEYEQIASHHSED
jgi:arylsulfatase